MDELAVACQLSPEELRKRGDDLLPGLLRLADDQEAIADGYRFSFAATALATVFQIVDAERQCCPFFRFEITVEPGAGPISLALTGPSGTQAFIETFLESLPNV